MQPTPVTDASNAGPWRKARSSNSTTDNSGVFSSILPTTTEPTEATAGYFRLNKSGGWTATRIQALFFGVGSNNNTFVSRIINWTEIGGLWIPVPVWQGTATLSSTIPGIAGKLVDENQFFADTIATSKGTDGIDCEPFSPADNTIAHLVLDIKGPIFLDFRFDKNGSATSCNALFRTL